MSAFFSVIFRHCAKARVSNEEDIKKATKNITMWLSQKTSELRRRSPQQQANIYQEAPTKNTDQVEEETDKTQEAIQK